MGDPSRGARSRTDSLLSPVAADSSARVSLSTPYAVRAWSRCSGRSVRLCWASARAGPNTRPDAAKRRAQRIGCYLNGEGDVDWACKHARLPPSAWSVGQNLCQEVEFLRD